MAAGVRRAGLLYRERMLAADYAVELAYYGDSINDRYILEACGFPYTVNPSASLRVLAERQHWPILSWKLEAVK